jgi:hypothetical protein
MRLSTTLETTVTVSDAGQDNFLYDQPRAVSDENGWSGIGSAVLDRAPFRYRRRC